MNLYYEKAVERLNKESAPLKSIEKTVGDYVRDVLISFCEQNEEFAEAVADAPKKFDECVKKIMENHGNCLSDAEAVRRGASFYFPGSKIESKMRIIIDDRDEEKSDTSSHVIDLSLDDLIGL